MGDGKSYPFWEKDSMNTYLIDTYQVLVGAYCIRPKTYRVFGSMDYVYSKNGWQIDSFVP